VDIIRTKIRDATDRLLSDEYEKEVKMLLNERGFGIRDTSESIIGIRVTLERQAQHNIIHVTSFDIPHHLLLIR